MKSSTKYVFLAVICLFCSLCSAYPKPAVVPGPALWTLDVRYDRPQQITMTLANGDSQRFWYTILTLTNNSAGFDVPFYPSCDLMTDTFQIVPAGKTTRRGVFEAIKLRHQGKYPFIEPLEFVSDKVLQGSDNTIDIAIIWPDFDNKAKNISLFIGGLSNETVPVDHPLDTDANGKPVKIFLRKTLKLDYSIGGDENLRSDAGLVYKNKSWVMR